jgi:hypothetical protein
MIKTESRLVGRHKAAVPSESRPSGYRQIKATHTGENTANGSQSKNVCPAFGSEKKSDPKVGVHTGHLPKAERGILPSKQFLTTKGCRFGKHQASSAPNSGTRAGQKLSLSKLKM